MSSTASVLQEADLPSSCFVLLFVLLSHLCSSTLFSFFPFGVTDYDLFTNLPPFYFAFDIATSFRFKMKKKKYIFQDKFGPFVDLNYIYNLKTYVIIASFF